MSPDQCGWRIEGSRTAHTWFRRRARRQNRCAWRPHLVALGSINFWIVKKETKKEKSSKPRRTFERRWPHLDNHTPRRPCDDPICWWDRPEGSLQHSGVWAERVVRLIIAGQRSRIFSRGVYPRREDDASSFSASILLAARPGSPRRRGVGHGGWEHLAIRLHRVQCVHVLWGVRGHAAAGRERGLRCRRRCHWNYDPVPRTSLTEFQPQRGRWARKVKRVGVIAATRDIGEFDLLLG